MEECCKYCRKLFKSKKSKENHILKQICIPAKDKTYCKLCNYTAENKLSYKKHLVSAEHLAKITSMTTTKVKMVNSIFELDPYLSSKEKRELSDPIGNSELIIQTKNNTAIKIDLAAENEKRERIETARKQMEERIKRAEQAKIDAKRREEEARIKAEEDRKYINGRYVVEPENKLDYNSVLNAELYTVPAKTERQERILRFLIHYQGAPEDIRKGKLKEILKLLSMEDANYLMSHIRRCEKLTILGKQYYMDFIDQFIMELVKLINAGVKEINGKNIIDYVSKLTK